MCAGGVRIPCDRLWVRCVSGIRGWVIGWEWGVAYGYGTNREGGGDKIEIGNLLLKGRGCVGLVGEALRWRRGGGEEKGRMSNLGACVNAWQGELCGRCG
jgi:hypothetical protein